MAHLKNFPAFKRRDWQHHYYYSLCCGQTMSDLNVCSTWFVVIVQKLDVFSYRLLLLE